MGAASTRLAAMALLALGFLVAGTPQRDARAAGPDPSVYQSFLDRYVSPGRTVGRYTLSLVDYDRLAHEQDSTGSPYQAVLLQLREFQPNRLVTKEEKLAFWINVYNIGAIRLIMDHYPVESIRSLKISWIRLPWGKEIVDVGSRKYSLGEIEHGILIGTLKEPMAHFGIVCASLSCPELASEAYTAGNVRRLLEKQARRFLSDPEKGLRIDHGEDVIYFSQIFKFDATSFPDGAQGALPFIAPLLSGPDRAYLLSGEYSIRYLDYDWSLNSLSRAEK